MNRFVAFAALVCVVGTGVGVEYAEAAPIAPKLRAKVHKKNDSVRISWRTRKLNRRAVNIIEIERARDGAAFEALDAVKRRPSRYTDRPDGGSYQYRVRVHSDDEVSSWSNVVGVDVVGVDVPWGGRGSRRRRERSGLR